MQLSNISQLWEIPENFYQDKKINKEHLTREIKFPIYRVGNQHMKQTMNILKRFTPDLINFDKIYHDLENNNCKAIVLDPSKLLSIEKDLEIKELEIIENLNGKFSDWVVEYISKIITYDNYKFSTLLKWILPVDNQLSGFTIIGHIIHINLKEELEAYKYAIGEIMLDKIPNTKCVVSKVSQIESRYRNFELELLAGEPNYISTIKEHDCQFTFDFSKVYWNSRLETEHRRIVKLLNSNDIVYDACAGVGPFAIPAAKKGCRVIANDLNGESCLWLRKNIQINSTKRKSISIDLHNLDAQEFIEKIVLPDIYKSSTESTGHRFFLIMNLPSIAIDFLSSIVVPGALSSLSNSEVLLTVLCYCFIGKKIPKNVIEDKIQQQLGDRVDRFDLRYVRNVAPSKDIYCAEIVVRLSNSGQDNNHNDGPAKKRHKSNSSIE